MTTEGVSLRPATGVYVSTGAFQTSHVEEILRLAEQSGLAQLELSSGAICAESVMKQVDAAIARGMRILIHNYFPRPEQPFVLNLASDSEDVLNRSLAHCRRAIDLCVRFRSPLFTVHSGFLVDAKPEQLGTDLKVARRLSRDPAQERFVKSLKEICDYASKAGIRVGIENNVLAPFNLVDKKNKLLLCVTSEDIIETINAAGCSNLGVLIDFAHAKVSAHTLGFDLESFMTALDPYVYGFHVSENDGTADQNWPVDESSWSLPHIRRRAEVPVVLESYKLDEGILLRCTRILESQLKAGSL